MSHDMDNVEEFFAGFLLLLTLPFWLPALLALKFYRWLK